MTLFLNALGMICPLGHTHDDIRGRLFDARSGVLPDPTRCAADGAPLALGAVTLDDAALPCDAALPLRDRSRNNRLALQALSQIRDQVDAAMTRFGAHRIGIVLGTSTSGIAEGEAAFRKRQHSGAFPEGFHYGQQELGSPAAALAATLGVMGPAHVHSSACSSSGKAMAAAARLINMGLCDAVLCGGVDTLCDFTIAGFTALESVSAARCNPLSQNRCGINIGEGAALFLMSREPATVALAGWGESSDAHHISAPDPSGGGALRAMRGALARAGLSPDQIDYINLHGTATPQNDAMESKAVHALFGAAVPVSSTKPFTGHTLGAASAIEAGLCWLAMQDANGDGLLPPHLWDGVADPALPVLDIVAPGRALGHPPRAILSNSFAFGGSNVSLLLTRQDR
ncbi:beta-ketoacyl-[acyl-carrier-protein] synthase family protein [Herbaspirillum sp. alder98]|uniref:beta-ketoacyl-[acyl-carrier-protein] synthase family protein n=1 Tax=Herbaspirillum sp. alder98 TaxID=2913096 RepID=UPI001CD844FA|nr:beta-ketoacyl-[acyl-carrier-protein] synthase family protein [Herbaspirillum sp. alder98]MCA1324659.1 beta-ketoacyl-[acyl-carrier-protein] synthase family protein [Herbaspirillum sp. alder98]